MSNIEFRDIRFPSVNSLKLLRGNVINRSSISSNYTSDTILIPNVSFPLASRIFKYTDIEVNMKDNWIYVKNNDLEALHDAYLPYKEIIENVVDSMENTTQDNNIEEDIVSDIDESKHQIDVQEQQLSEEVNTEEDTSTTNFNENNDVQDTSDNEEKSEDTHDDGDVDYYDYAEEDNDKESKESNASDDTVIIEQQVSNDQPNRNNSVYSNQQYHSNKHKRKH